jgi:NAD(P)-dependent dehydrogenase (short-subunit alcohol dehydrogenase family)
MQLKDRTAVVLGASAEGGTGWAIAEALAAEGARVVVAARRREPLEALARKIAGLAVVCDAGAPEQIAGLARAAAEACGPLDIAVNSAASPITGTIAETALKGVRRSLEVNYLAHVCFVREMATVMRPGGAITLISSSAAAQPVPAFFPYAAAKAATDALVKYAALEYGPRGIRVNSILPGPIKTPLAAHLYEPPGAEAIFAREIPLGRVGLPDDYARATLALYGMEFVTGLNLPVGGGMHLRRAPHVGDMVD